MTRDDIIICRYHIAQSRRYDIQVVKKVVDGMAITSSGLRIDAYTGVEHNEKYGIRQWEVLSKRTNSGYFKVKDYLTAKKWMEKISEFPDRLVEVYRACTQSANDGRVYLHELPADEYKNLFVENMGSINAQFKKPLWCGHPFALQGWFGCPKLLKGQEVTERKCSRCSCFVNPRYGDYFKRLRIISGLTVAQIGSYLKIKDYRKIEEGLRQPKSEEVEKLISLYSINDWFFVDVLKMLYSPTGERDEELDKTYRQIIQNKFSNEKKKNNFI